MKTLLRLAAIAVFGVLMILMLGPFGNVEAASGISDKVAHFVAFGAILLCLGVLFPRTPRILLAIGAVAVGAAVELIQGQVGRDASWGDLLADLLGVIAVLLIWGGWRHFGPRTESRDQTSKTR